MHVPPVSDPLHPHASLLTAIDAHAATTPGARRPTDLLLFGEGGGFGLVLDHTERVEVRRDGQGRVEVTLNDTSKPHAPEPTVMDGPLLAVLIARMAALPEVRDLLRVLPGPALAGLVTGPESEQDPGYEVRTYAPASGTDDAGPTVVLDAFGWTVTIRQRDTGDADEDPGPSRDTVIEITDGEGPLELIVRGDTRHLT